MKKFLSFALAAALVMALSGCERSARRFQRTYFDLFDTVTVIVGYEKSESDFNARADEIYDELRAYNALYDIYNDYDGVNNIKTINDSAGIAPIEVDERVIDLLEFALYAGELTGGKMNVAMGSILTLWHAAREKALESPESAYLPEKAALTEAAEHMDASGVVIDRAAGTVYLTDPEMRLDVGAVGKGYAVERVAEMLERDGVSGYMISVGGNVRTIGARPDGDWLVGIEDPSGERDYLLKVRADDMSVVTSGSYQRYFTVDGKNYHHIIDPDTLYPDDTWSSVTVLAADSAMADALSTALFNMSAESGAELIRSLDGVEAMWVSSDGAVSYSDNFELYTAEDRG